MEWLSSSQTMSAPANLLDHAHGIKKKKKKKNGKLNAYQWKTG